MMVFVAAFVIMLFAPDVAGCSDVAVSFYAIVVIATAAATMAACILKHKAKAKTALLCIGVSFAVYFFCGLHTTLILPVLYAVFAIVLWKMATKNVCLALEDYCQE